MLASSHLPATERLAAGRKLRERVARSSHASWAASRNRSDPIELLQESDRGRLPALRPIRYARMRQSPFAFLRGAAALMAFDLASTPVTGIRSQACGDCHVANFGGFATPERRLVFDINDFDETLPAPWEGTSSAWPRASRSRREMRDSGKTAALKLPELQSNPAGSTCTHMPRCPRLRCGIPTWM
jgi:uncharacterized protein DUF2252